MISKTLKVSADLDSIDVVIPFVKDILTESGCDKNMILKIRLVVEEIFVNIISYAYEDEVGDCTMEVTVTDSPKVFTMSFKDSGKKYNPLQREEVDLSLDAFKQRVGGYGIHIVKKSVDQLYYKYENDCNILSFSKKLF